jgi:hypothetical protein
MVNDRSTSPTMPERALSWHELGCLIFESNTYVIIGTRSILRASNVPKQYGLGTHTLLTHFVWPTDPKYVEGEKRLLAFGLLLWATDY